MMRIVAAMILIFPLTLMAQQRSSDKPNLEMTELARRLETSGTLKQLDGRYFADIRKPFVLTDGILVLDPDDRTQATEPGHVIDVQIGEKYGRKVWLKLMTLKRVEVKDLLQSTDFEALLVLLRNRAVTDKDCPGAKECTKTCQNTAEWCCEYKCL